jgi:hypothetical protein
MALSTPVYCTREQVAGALDVRGTARSAAQIDAILPAARDSVEATLNRVFVPELTTRYFDWPNRSGAASWRLWLEDSEVVTVTTLTAGGVVIPPADYFLEPNSLGPPYDRIEVDLSSSSAFASNTGTYQRAIAVLGVFGYRLDSAPVGALAEDLDLTETGVDVTDTSGIGVGDLLLCGTERMLVTEKGWLTTAQTVQTPLTASAASQTVAVTDGTKFFAGEPVLLDAEQMMVTAVAGNNLTVTRAWDGTVLATHTGSTIYAPRTLTVVRASSGTTAATHLTGVALTRHVVPGLVNRLAVAEALITLLGEGSGYARPAGSGGSTRPTPGEAMKPVAGSVDDLRRQAEGQFRRLRSGAV